MKRFSFIATLIGVLVGLAACAPPAPAQPGAANAPQPAQAPANAIKIGILAPTTGTVAASGKDMLNGWNLWWTQHGNQIAVRPVQMFVEDDAGNPDTALTKARLLVEQRGVHMLVGPLLANTGLAVAGYVKGIKTPLFLPIVSADDLTQRQRIPNVVRVAGWTSSQTTHPFGEWARKQGYNKVVTIAQDYAFGQENTGGFLRTFTQNGGQVLAQIWNPIGTPDFSSYLAQIKSLNPDVVFAEETGADSVRFMKQWNDFGFKDKIVLLGNETLFDQSLLRSMGPEAEGMISVGHFAEGRNDPVTQDFVQAYDKAYGQLPSYYSADMYVAAQWISQAIESVKGNVEDTDGFLKAVRTVNIGNTPMGPEKMDDYGNPVFNVYLRKVVKRDDGRLWNVVTDTWPNVSQFWTFNPSDFLQDPVYSRDFQGIKK